MKAAHQYMCSASYMVVFSLFPPPAVERAKRRGAPEILWTPEMMDKAEGLMEDNRVHLQRLACYINLL